jgi:GDP-4-dehydro-6-deoxy-D-mannose reductase
VKRGEAMSYVITGASGFVAGHLIEHIFRGCPGAVLTCLDVAEPDYSFLGKEARNSIRFVKADLLSESALLKTLESARPSCVIHLAAYSSVAYSWQHPIESFMNNSNIFLNLLEAVRVVDPDIRVLSVGSSEQYGVGPPR